MLNLFLLLYSPSLEQQPNAGQGRLIHEVSRSHTMAQYSRYNSSGRVIGPSQGHLTDKHRTLTRDKYPCHRRGFLFVLCTLSVLLCPDCPALPFVLYCTTHTKHEHSFPLRDSKPQPQQAIGRRPLPQTTWPLGSAYYSISHTTFSTQ